MKSIRAIWNFDLRSTHLTDYKKGEHLVISGIYTGTFGIDAAQKYGLEVKVDQWNKPFKTKSESVDHKLLETLSVTLHPLDNPKEMQADFEDIVYENGKIKLKFSGTTLLVRSN